MSIRPCGRPGRRSVPRRGRPGPRGGTWRSGLVRVVFAWVAPWLSASCTTPIKTGPAFGGQASRRHGKGRTPPVLQDVLPEIPAVGPDNPRAILSVVPVRLTDLAGDRHR